ncbi:MAG TPA: ATP-binding cassette domain-containing protein [Pilimelia sp.]|nr:ATP-binding cassette domain-containing protein [Pilimelia sp.]
MGWLDRIGGAAHRFVRALSGMAPDPRPASEVLRERLRLLRLVPRAGAGLTAALVAAHTVTALTPAALAVATGWLVTELVAVVGTGAAGGLPGPLAAFAAVLVAEQFGESARDTTDLLASQQIDRSVRRRLRDLVTAPRGIAHLEEPGYADDALRASDLGENGWRVRSPGTAATGQTKLVFRVACAIVSAGLLARYFPALAAGLLAAALLNRAIIRQQWTGAAGVWDALVPHERQATYWSNLAASAPAAKELRVFGLGEWVLGRRMAVEEGRLAASLANSAALQRRQGWVLALSFGAGGAALLVPGLAAARGAITVGELATCLGAAWGIFRISGMGLEAFDIEYGLGAVQAVDRLERRHAAEAPPPPDDPARATQRAPQPASQPTPARPPRIRFEGVGFRYPGAAAPTLAGLDLDIRPGEVLAVVGVNGAGKTTMMKLLGGLYPPTAGRITVDGVDLADLDATAWRRRLTVVFQDFVRYPLSARENIALGAPHRRDGVAATIAAVAADADATALLAGLPDGLDTVLARGRTGGVDLSGGQWQRIALARALYAARSGRHVVVLDEPTAHLDVHAEAEFFERVVRAVDGATVLLISHRLATIRNADRIVLLGGGRIVAAGTHDELLAAGGEYARLFRLQAARFQPAGPADDGGTEGSAE